MSDVVQQMGIAPAGYRLPAASRVEGVVLQVADLNRSLKYYSTVIGLVVLGRERRTAWLGAPGASESDALVELREVRGVAPVPRGRRFGLFHFAILLPDRPALGRFLAHLGRQRVAPGTADHFVSEALYLYDPDGLGIEVYADRPRDRWRALAGEVLMTTDPLDVEGVLAAGEGGAWAGAPEGTTMGHVHVHVGDLDQANAFYHKALGLDRMAWGFPGALFLAVGGYHHHLAVNTWTTGATRPGEQEAQLLEWRMGVPRTSDANAAARNAEFGGFETTKDGRDWLIGDPWGTVVRLAPPTA
jgi:catechol 2,3-dioxygenase